MTAIAGLEENVSYKFTLTLQVGDDALYESYVYDPNNIALDENIDRDVGRNFEESDYGDEEEVKSKVQVDKDQDEKTKKRNKQIKEGILGSFELAKEFSAKVWGVDPTAETTPQAIAGQTKDANLKIKEEQVKSARK